MNEKEWRAKTTFRGAGHHSPWIEKSLAQIISGIVYPS